MLDVEAALARAQAAAGLIAAEHAEAIAAACRAERYDVDALGAAGRRRWATPAAPLVRALRAEVGDPAAADVHRGATSQDVIDSAAMLVARRALDAAARRPRAARPRRRRGWRASTARRSMAGRTLLQQAVPITFGLKAAGWLVGLDEAAQRLDAVRRTRLAAQLGGAAGTLAALGDAGIDVLSRFARELGLAEPVLPWHTDAHADRRARRRPGRGERRGGQGRRRRRPAGPDRGRRGARGRRRRPRRLLRHAAQAQPGRGDLGAGRRPPGARASWPTCWPRWSTSTSAPPAPGTPSGRPLRELLRATGSAAAWLRDCLEHLEVDPERMRANLDDAMLAERVAGAIGGADAGDRVREALAAGRSLADVAREHLAEDEAERVLDPATYLGATDQLIDRALSAHAHRS